MTEQRELKEYRVVWEIDVVAPSPEAAAKAAKKYQELDDDYCSHFAVHDGDRYAKGIWWEHEDIDVDIHTTPEDECPSQHWNDGTDYCADCDEPLGI